MQVTAVVLAGGRGSRIGGAKALASLGGRPLISYPLAAARAARLDAVVVAKRDTRLPALDVPLLLEPDTPVHPLLGVITALERYDAVLAIPCDMPFLDPAELAALAALPADLATLQADQPFPSLYRRSCLERLRSALVAGQSMRSIHAHSQRLQNRGAAVTHISVNTPADLAAAEARLRTG